MKMTVFILLLVGGLFSSSVQAQDNQRSWTNQVELAGVFTSGNSESNHLSFKDVYTWKNEHAEFKLNLSAVRAENTRFLRYATGSADQFEVFEDSESELSAENYNVSTKYNRKMGKTISWFQGLSWTRDEIAGVKSRAGISLGITKTWISSDTHKLSTSAGAKWIKESNVYEPEGFDDSYPALALMMDHTKHVTKNSVYTQDLDIDVNTEESSDYLVDWHHGFSVSVSQRIALKLGLQLKYDNEPALEGVPLLNSNIVLSVPLEDLDTIFTTSLVINW